MTSRGDVLITPKIPNSEALCSTLIPLTLGDLRSPISREGGGGIHGQRVQFWHPRCAGPKSPKG